MYKTRLWDEVVSDDAAVIDFQIGLHRNCKNVDYESMTTYCYDCCSSIRWVG